MSYTNGLDKPSDYFNTELWTGTGGNRNIDFGHNTDLVWIKSRGNAYSHRLVDSVRGATKSLYSNLTDAESIESAGVTAFITNGVSLGGDSGVNYINGYVGWSWLAGGTAVSNTDGSITSSVSANTTAGFSIATWTTPSSGTVFDVGHGLGGKPDMMIMKSRGSASDWWTWHIGLGDNTTDYLSLNNTNAEASISGMWGTVGAGTSTFGYTAGTSAPTSTDTVAYFFRSIKGFSKFGSYVGNGSTDGTFVYTGFKPAFVMIKRTDAINDWFILDNKRNTYNPERLALYPNLSNAEYDYTSVFDFCSNGFKLRDNSSWNNASGGTYIYMAFAENPFTTSTGIPATAR